jgi:hypothetical protein
MKLGSKPGLAAGLAVVALATAAPAALAGPTVKVRVEGEHATLLERTTVTLPDAPSVPGCASGTAGAALDVATAGNWSRAAFVTTILGESHNFDPVLQDYWAEWIDRGSGYKRGGGVCSDVLNAGDELLMLVDTFPPTDGSTTKVPLELEAAGGVRGTDLSVRVTGAITTTPYGDPGDGTSKAVEGATVSGGGVSAVTDPDGRAVLRFEQTGPVTLKASKRGSVPSGAVTIQITEPGQALPPGGSAAPDRLAPLAKLLGIADHQTFRKGKGPRTLKASVSDASGLAAVKLRLTRRSGGRCFYFSGRRQELERTRCGRAFFFKAGDSPDVSYLLPERLGPGRYVLDLAAVDRAGNRSALARGSTRVVFTVR